MNWAAGDLDQKGKEAWEAAAFHFLELQEDTKDERKNREEKGILEYRFQTTFSKFDLFLKNNY
jgi:hypothetical protein